MRWLLFITTSLIVEKSFALVELRWSNINSDFDPVCWWIIISVVFTSLTGFSGAHCGIIWVSGKAEKLTQKYMRGFRSPYEGWILNSHGISLARLRNLSYLARWNCCYLDWRYYFTCASHPTMWSQFSSSTSLSYWLLDLTWPWGGDINKVKSQRKQTHF